MMMKIGDQLILELKYTDKLDKFKCKVVEKRDSYIYIDYPINMETNKTAFFIDGTQLKCSFVAGDGSVYLFETGVIGRVKQNIPMIVLHYPGDDQLIKIQRRQYVRVETAIDVAVHPRASEFEPFVAVTDDISAGGAAIIAANHQKLATGMELILWAVLPMQNGDYHYFKFPSKVVRIIPLENGRNKVSLQFQHVEPQERQVLFRFCFDRQVSMRKKGLLS